MLPSTFLLGLFIFSMSCRAPATRPAFEPQCIGCMPAKGRQLVMSGFLCADGSPEAALEAFGTADGGPSEDGPSSVSTEAQGSGHNDGDDDATSLPHVPSDDSVAAGHGVEVIALDSPTTAARKVWCPSPCAAVHLGHVCPMTSGQTETPARYTATRCSPRRACLVCNVAVQSSNGTVAVGET